MCTYRDVTNHSEQKVMFFLAVGALNVVHTWHLYCNTLFESGRPVFPTLTYEGSIIHQRVRTPVSLEQLFYVGEVLAFQQCA